MLKKIDTEQGLYVCVDNNHHSFLGFEVALRRAKGVAEWSGQAPPNPALAGSAAGYAEYYRIMDAGQRISRERRQQCPTLLSPQLVSLEGWRVEVVTTYGEIRSFIVGKSTGWLPVHLEIARANSLYGGAAEFEYRSVRSLYKSGR